MKPLDILIPTCSRKTALALTLSGLVNQSFLSFNVHVSDQTESDDDYLESAEIQSLVRLFRLKGRDIQLHRHLPRKGMAEQRDFLLNCSEADYVLFVDDDLFLEREVVERMMRVMREEGCGFVGAAPIGLSYLEDYRPAEQKIELWETKVEPEPMVWGSIPWERHKAHNAANPYHIQLRYASNGITKYKVAWVGACVLYDRRKLLDVGGYSFWRKLPPNHAGEDVVVQILLANKYGGCGILPSGVYHLECPTTVVDRQVDAAQLLEDLLRRDSGANAQG